jgi:hypothetical protein
LVIGLSLKAKPSTFQSSTSAWTENGFLPFSKVCFSFHDLDPLVKNCYFSCVCRIRGWEELGKANAHSFSHNHLWAHNFHSLPCGRVLKEQLKTAKLANRFLSPLSAAHGWRVYHQMM